MPLPDAVEIIATCRYYSKAARKLGVDRKTVYRWLQSPRFAAAVKLRRDELLAEYVTAYHATARDAIKCLRAAMKTPDAAGVRAALAVLKSTGISDKIPRPRSAAEIERLDIGTLRVADGAMVVDDPTPTALPDPILPPVPPPTRE